MSVVGVIVVYRCDGKDCSEHISVHTQSDVDRFGRDWFVGGDVDYCPRCRDDKPTDEKDGRI